MMDAYSDYPVPTRNGVSVFEGSDDDEEIDWEEMCGQPLKLEKKTSARSLRPPSSLARPPSSLGMYNPSEMRPRTTTPYSMIFYDSGEVMSE